MMAGIGTPSTAAPSPAPGGEGGVHGRLQAMCDSACATSGVSEAVRGDLMRRARDVQNDVDEANELLREIDGPTPTQVIEVGLLLRQGGDPNQDPAASSALRMPCMVVQSSRVSDGELLAVWPVPRFYTFLEELRDRYQSRCDRQREGLPVDGARGMTVAWADNCSPSPNGESAESAGDALYELSNADSDEDDDDD